MTETRRPRAADRVRERGTVEYEARAPTSVEVVSASEAAKSMGTLLDRVRAHGVEVVIERHGTPIARLTPIGSAPVCTPKRFAELLRTLPPLDEDYRSAVRRGIDDMNQPTPTDTPWES
jgi:prevent-host-death family protein